MACYGLERWSKIAVMSSTCHDYVVCCNSWQFRLWILSLLTAHGAVRSPGPREAPPPPKMTPRSHQTKHSTLHRRGEPRSLHPLGKGNTRRCRHLRARFCRASVINPDPQKTLASTIAKLLEPSRPNSTPVAKSRMLEIRRNAGIPQSP